MNQFKELSAEALTKNPFQMIGSQWMLITAGDEKKVNTMTASWGGLGIMFHKNVAFVVIRPQRYTKEFVDQEETFSLSFLPNEYRKTLNYLGSVSGRDEDKVAKSGLTVNYSYTTPFFNEAEYVLLCKKLVKQPLDGNSLFYNLEAAWYPNQDFHTLYIAEITKVLQKSH